MLAGVLINLYIKKYFCIVKIIGIKTCATKLLCIFQISIEVKTLRVLFLYKILNYLQFFSVIVREDLHLLMKLNLTGVQHWIGNV